MKTAYPRFTNAVSIRLYSNIPFDNTYKHHSLISSKFTYNGSAIYTGGDNDNSCVERFINRKNYSILSKPYYYPRYDLTGEFNFDFSNGLIGSVVLELTPEQTNANYMRVKVGDSVNGYDYYYYFVTGISQINSDTYKLSLELDVLMTYQDEFLDGMKDVPVFTSRKHSHRYTNNGLMPHCADLRNGEENYSGVKPSYIENIVTPAIFGTKNKVLKDFLWLYICYDQVVSTGTTGEKTLAYRYKNIYHPYAIGAVPIHKSGKTLQIWSYVEGSSNLAYSCGGTTLEQVMNLLVSDGHVHACKISPYPPIHLDDSDTSITITENENTIEIRVPASEISLLSQLYTWDNYKCTLKWYDRDAIGNLLFITNEKTTNNLFDSISLSLVNTNAPLVTSNRYLDPKLLFPPFKKYFVGASYGNVEIFPELLYSKGVFSKNNVSDDNITIKSVASANIGDNTLFTFLESKTDRNGVIIIRNYNYENIGLSSNVNYVLPAGTNALDLFNSTQANSFYQSKTASGITAGLTIAGGVGSLVGGALSTAFASKTMGVGLIAGGISAIASGLASVSNTIKSTNAKIEDLKNTPDSFNVAGSSFTSDMGRTNTLLPYIVIYKCSDETIESADDFFYNYGYQVARECYFNTEIKFDNDVTGVVDNNLFGRTIFNYIQTNEELTNKINADIPLIVKQKISSVFNNGITLWSWFGFDELWGVFSGEQLAILNPDRWFMKCILDNTEYNGGTY